LYVVPEAQLETLPEAIATPEHPRRGRGRGRRGQDILPITPEILAEVRQDEGETRPAVAKRRGGARPPAPEPVPVAAIEPAVELVQSEFVVPEATLEGLVGPWDEADEAFFGVVPTDGPAESVADAGRRKRRRSRDRDREPRTGATGRPAGPALPLSSAGQVERDESSVELIRSDRESREADLRDREGTRTEREFKEILINVDERETRIAVIENGRLVELHVEREERVVGGVYKGRVANVLQGMDAAFVDIGLDRNAFLYVGDILFDDPKGRGGDGESPTRRTSRDVKIKDLARPGQEVLVQVVKGPRGTKGARVSTKISIPGRYLVLMPDGDHLGVSRKIEDGRERDRLRRLTDELQPKGFGLIARTEAEGRTEEELRQDLDYLLGVWRTISERHRQVRAPAILHKDLGIVLKTIRDLFGTDVDRLLVDSGEEFEKIVDTLNQLAPDLVDRVSMHEGPEPLFVRYNVEDEIDRLLRRKVWLRNGAYLLIDTTEALTTIDVNTGKFVGSTSLAETILKTNLDAAEEIARQLRLRDIGGMIVLDFIDMSSSRDRQLVMRALETALRKDRTRTKVAHISPLGLVEMTRKRTADNVTDAMTHVCPYCQGRGRVWSPETMSLQIEREIRRKASGLGRGGRSEMEAVLVYANPEVAAWLVGPEGDGVEHLERTIGRPVYVRARHSFHIEQYEILPADLQEVERQLGAYHGGQVVSCAVSKLDVITPPRSAGWVDGYLVDVANAVRFQGQTIRVRLTDVRRSMALGEPVAPSHSVDRTEPI
jgi:ribonuclease G